MKKWTAEEMDAMTPEESRATLHDMRIRQMWIDEFKMEGYRVVKLHRLLADELLMGEGGYRIEEEL